MAEQSPKLQPSQREDGCPSPEAFLRRYCLRDRDMGILNALRLCFKC